MKRTYCCLALGLILSFLIPVSLHANCKQHHLVTIDPAKIDIVRDSFGVPHIFAKTDAEVAYGLGWATCEDDFKTLQWGLLAGRSELGRLLGKKGARIDYAVKLLRARKTVNEQYDTVFSPHFKELLDGYIQGVNEYARTHPKEVLVKKGFPATTKDIAVGYMMSQCLMAGIDGVLEGILNGNIKKPVNNGQGSNGFAFNSKITKSDETYLDINAHQPLEGPFSWYEAHLCSEEGWNIVGGMFHGSPCIFLGTNENLGWGHTTNGFDEIDVFSLTMNPKNNKEYKFDGHWEKLQTSKAKLVVNLSKKHKFMLPVFKKIWWSKYGPTMKGPNGDFYAVRMGALLKIGAPEEWFRMNKAKNFSEFRKALDMQQISRQTVIYADRYDTIFILSNGLLPNRNPNYNWSGVLPGDTSATLWTTYHPESDLPQALNPDCGYVFNTNNSAYDCTGPSCDLDPSKYDPTMGYNLERDNRSMRFHEIMKTYSKVDWNDFLKIKYDDHFPKNDSLVPAFETEPQGLMKLSAAKHPDIADAINIIQNGRHDGELDNPDLPILLYSMYSMRAQHKGGIDYNNDPVALDSLAYNSVKAGKEHMMKYFGSIQVPLGKVQLLVRDTVEMPVSGGPDMIRAAYCAPYKDGKLKMFIGESYIQLVKFKKGEPPHIETVAPYGASNTPGAKHYTDQMKLFTNQQRKTMSLDKKYVYTHAESVYHPIYK